MRYLSKEPEFRPDIRTSNPCSAWRLALCFGAKHFASCLKTIIPEMMAHITHLPHRVVVRIPSK